MAMYIEHLATQVPSQSLWHQWSEWFVAYEMRSDDLFRAFPWHLLTNRQLQKCLQATQRGLQASPTPREVCFAFQGLDLEGRFSTIGHADVYDSRVYDFGEDGRDMPTASEGGGKACARILVRAVSNAQAQLDAIRTLYVMLDTLVFVSASSRLSPFAFNPRVGVSVDVKDLSTGDWTGEWRPYRGTFSTTFTADDDFMRVAHHYDDLLNWEAANRLSAPQSHISAAFFRALDSYRKGRWATDAANAFLFEWFGMEGLFDDSTALFRDAPRLHTTWFDIDPPRWLSLYREREELVREIIVIDALRVRLDADPDLIGWDRDNRVLLQPSKVSRARKYIPRRESALRQQFAAYSRMLHRAIGQPQMLRRIVENAQNSYRFRLHYLYALRNAMVHEAALPAPQTEIYAEALDAMFYTLLAKIANVLLNLPGARNTIVDVTEWHQQPFT
jgi:hypothetical protein